MQFRKFNEMGPKLIEGIAGATKNCKNKAYLLKKVSVNSVQEALKLLEAGASPQTSLGELTHTHPLSSALLALSFAHSGLASCN